MDNKTKIKYIQQIISSGNITRAAKELFISQPYLSRIINEIETDNGITLFDRSSKTYNLTFAGGRYIYYLKEKIALNQEMANELEMISNNRRGRVVIGINPALGSSILPRVLPQFHAQFPGIVIELVEGNSFTTETMLTENQIDLAIGMTPLLKKSISYDILYEEKLHLVTSRSSGLFKSNNEFIVPFSEDLKSLEKEPVIMLPNEYDLGRLVDEFYRNNQIKPNVLLTTNTVYTALGLVLNGMGSTFIPMTGMVDITRLKSNKNIQIYSMDNYNLSTQFVLKYKKGRQLSPSALAFFNLAKQHLTNSE